MKITIEKDGIVAEGLLHPKKVTDSYETKTKKGNNVETTTFLICDISTSDSALSKKPFKEVTEMIYKDKEIDFDLIGKIIHRRKRVILDEKNSIVNYYKILDTLEKDGEIQEKEHEYTLGNMHAEIPLKILSKNITKKEVFEKYLIEKSYFITHSEGTSYKFFYDLSGEFEEDKMYWVRAFDPETKKPAPFVIMDGGKKYTATFIEGKQIDDKYLLMLHLVEREFKIPITKKEKKEEIKKKELEKKEEIKKRIEKKKEEIKSGKKSSQGRTEDGKIVINKTPLMIEYEKETQKNAIWGGKPTIGFKRWRAKR